VKLFIASDHAGYELKEHLINYLEENGVEVIDKGPFELDKTDDYPDWISLVAQEVSQHPDQARGIVIGYSGQGEAIVANKFRDVRAGVYYGYNQDIITLMREHNNTNVLSLGAEFVSKEEAQRAVDAWIETQFSNDERHIRRIRKIREIDIRR